MARKLFTKEEVILCTYAAIFDENDFGGISKIHNLTKRSLASIKMKIQNIASMLDEERIKRYSNVKPLTGKTTGESGRRTNWDIVKIYINKPKNVFLKECNKIINVSKEAKI